MTTPATTPAPAGQAGAGTGTTPAPTTPAPAASSQPPSSGTGTPPASTPAPAGTTPAASAGEPKGGEQKPSGASPTGAPEAGGQLPEIKLPQGVSVDQAMLDGFRPLAKEVGLDSEKATKVAAWYAGQVQAAQKALVDDAAKQDAAWQQALKADAEFSGAGGKDFEANAKIAQKGVIWAGGEALAQEVEKYGLGNNPVLVKAFLKLGKALGEDTTTIQKAPSGADNVLNRDERWARAMYPSTQSGG